MNKDMREQLESIKQAWRDQNEGDKLDDDVQIEEIIIIIADSENDVRMTIMESRKAMNMPNVSPNSATREANRANLNGNRPDSIALNIICTDSIIPH